MEVRCVGQQEGCSSVQDSISDRMRVVPHPLWRCSSRWQGWHRDARGGREYVQAGTRWLESVGGRCPVSIASGQEGIRHRQQVAGKVTGITRRYTSNSLASEEAENGGGEVRPRRPMMCEEGNEVGNGKLWMMWKDLHTTSNVWGVGLEGRKRGR
jgi:hypothetical protein